MNRSTSASEAPPAPDDPWAALAAPEAPPLPVPGRVVKPVMPWSDAPGAASDVPVTQPDSPAAQPAAPAAPAAQPDSPAAQPDAPAAGTDAPPPGPVAREPATPPRRQPGPGPVPTALAAEPPTTRFPPGVAGKLAVYVYLLVDARTGRPFFVARGRGDRCFRHVEASRAGDPAGEDPRFPALDRIREAEADGRPVRIDILRHGLTTSEADLVVAAVDDALGLGLGHGLAGQRAPAVEVGASLAKRAKFKRTHRVVLLRTGSHGSAAPYESARHGWRIGRRWIDMASERAPRWAVLVTGDLVDAVYRIDAWSPSPTAGGSVDRYSFAGTRDAELERRYVGRSVSAYFGTGTPSQVTYVWCGPHWVNTAQ